MMVNAYFLGCRMKTKRAQSLKTRNLSIHGRFNTDEYKLIQRLAPDTPLSSEWLREYLKAQATRSDPDVVLRAIEELRTTVLSIMASLNTAAAAEIRSRVVRDIRERP
jgi:hypothetical protein